MNSIKSATGVCRKWGAAKGARTVTHLSKGEREAIKRGETVLIDGPSCDGRYPSVRRVIYQGGRYYARLPEVTT